MQAIVTPLPLYSDNEYVYSAIFGSQQVVLEFYYNKRAKAWHLDISGSDFEYLVRGLKLLPGIVHGADFSLEYLGVKGYLVLTPVVPSLRYDDIDPTALFQYYRLYYVEEV